MLSNVDIQAAQSNAPPTGPLARTFLDATLASVIGARWCAQEPPTARHEPLSVMAKRLGLLRW